MLDLLFYVFAALTVVPAFLMVTSRSPVTAAMFMIASFVGMACMFVLLEAFFLAILQVLVYAGAVMVLFLFIIMLLDMDEHEDLRTKTVPSMAAMVAGGLLLVIVLSFLKGQFEGPLEPVEEPTVATPQSAEAYDLVNQQPALPYSTKAKTFGYGLFTKYMLPFQVTGILLLVAMVGVVVLGRRHEPQSKEEQG